MSTDVSNASARSCSQVSQRMRLYRKRRRQGLQAVRILLPVTDIDYFTREVLTERQRQRPNALETELAGLIQQILDEIHDARARSAARRFATATSPMRHPSISATCFGLVAGRSKRKRLCVQRHALTR